MVQLGRTDEDYRTAAGSKASSGGLVFRHRSTVHSVGVILRRGVSWHIESDTSKDEAPPHRLSGHGRRRRFRSRGEALRWPGRWWVNNLGPASVAYVVFFMLAAFLVVPRRELATRIAVGVLLVTCVLEFLQLWHPPWLQAIRSTFLGASLLGTSFSWWDFPAWVVRAGVGWGVLQEMTSAEGPAAKKTDMGSGGLAAEA